MMKPTANKRAQPAKPKQSAGTEKTPVEQGTSGLEWIAAALGGLIFVTMIGYMVVLGFNEGDGPPDIRFTHAAAVHVGTGYLVTFKVANQGESTASGLVVKATLSRGKTEVESAEITVDYLPSGSQRSGGLIFKNDPAAYQLELAATAYLDP